MTESTIGQDTQGTTVVVEQVEGKPEKAPKTPPTAVLLSSGAWTTHPTYTLNCVDCGAERIIAIQDKFQVTRCVACQKKAQNKKRSEKKTAKAREARSVAKLEEARRLVAEADAKAKLEATPPVESAPAKPKRQPKTKEA